MYDIIDTGKFKIFCASRNAQNLYEPIIKEANVANKCFVKTMAGTSPIMPITGSFIYAHPPNYYGRPAVDWNVRQWEELFSQFNSMGMDTAIFQAAVWNELQECYYPSDYFKSFRHWNVIEPMLEAAGNKNISIFLGGYGSTVGLSHDVDKKIIEKEEISCINCLTEIMKYRKSFSGFYFSSETAFTGTYEKTKIHHLNRIYRRFFEYIKETDSSLTILMSPGTKYYPGKEQEMTDSWLDMLHKVPLDILAPQDSIGTCGNQLRYSEVMYDVWKNICEAKKITFWSNIEIFQREEDLSLLNHSITAEPERVIAQINMAAPVAEKLICWEAPYYLCDKSNPLAIKLADKVFSNKKGT
jgi:hypothetical protein